MQRIQQVEGDNVYDANMLVQQIDDNPKSIFPQYLTTERPDVFVSKLMEGKIGCLVDSSSTAVTAPTSFFEFFASPDDYYQRWILGDGVANFALCGICHYGFIHGYLCSCHDIPL